jgi:HNH endonuclease
MVLPSTNENCIWCGRRLVHRSLQVDCEDGFGPRPRSDEHIIPQMVFGKAITTDLCRCCNSRFGETVDHALAMDQRFVEAAQRIGISPKDLWTRFEGVQHSPDGKPVKTAVKDGDFRPQAELRSLDALAITSTNGEVSDRDLPHLRARLIAKVRAKSLGLPDERIVAEVDALLKRLRDSPGEVHYNPVIGEGFRSSPLDSRVVVTRESRPWETDWCLAKIVYELTRTVVSRDFQLYFKEVIATVRTFLERREFNPDGKKGVGIFTFTELPSGQAARCHTVEGRFDSHVFEWHLTFFGTACWSYRIEVTPIRAPAGGQIVRILNPLEAGDATVTVESADQNQVS